MRDSDAARRGEQEPRIISLGGVVCRLPHPEPAATLRERLLKQPFNPYVGAEGILQTSALEGASSTALTQ
jgi:hypothetical protein